MSYPKTMLIRCPNPVRLLTASIMCAISVSFLPALADGKAPTYKHKMEMGQLLYFNGDIDRAIKAFETACQLNDKAFEPHLNLVNLYVQKGGDEGLEKAAQECAEVLKLKPSNKDIHLVLGNLLRTQASTEKDPDKVKAKLLEAEKEVQTAVDMGAAEAMSENTLGLIALQRDEPEKALEHVDKALKKQPTFADAHLIRAVLLFKIMMKDAKPDANGTKDLTSPALKPKVDEVLKELDLSIKQKEKNAEAHTTKADILFALGKHDQALDEYKMGSEDDPKSHQSWAGIGNAHAHLAAKETDPDKKSKRLNEAKDAYTKAKRLKPNDKNMGYGLALMLEKLGMQSEARQEFQNTVMMEDDPLMRAQIQLHLQQMGGGGLGGMDTRLNTGSSDKTDGIGSGLFTGGALSQPFKNLIQIKAPPGQAKEKKKEE